ARIALVTGAGSGIGRAVAVGLARAGWTTVLAGRRREPLEQTATLARQASPHTREPIVVPTDVTDEASVAQLFEQVRARAGRLDHGSRGTPARAARADSDACAAGIAAHP